ncbi:MAG: 50S ribosomal protein L10 [Fimbriimonadales bacterium]|nr:50S ribosomal protein L10 [Fimbriimonadales bacterium]
MPTPEKVATVEKARQWYEKSIGVVFTDYRGLTVSEMQALRRALRSAGAEFRVVKNTLLRLALGEDIQKWPPEFHSGPTATAFVMGDESACAKALVAFAKEHRALQIKGAYLEGRVLGPQEFLQYSQLPTRQELLAIIAGLVVAPLQGIAGVASEVLAGPVRAVAAIAEKAGAAG